jgi:hydroxypyruvate reductase
MSLPSALRSVLLDTGRAALAAVNGRCCVRTALAANPLPGEVFVVAVGKAAAAMTLGACDALGTRLRRALVITKHGHADPELLTCGGVTLLQAGHPLPDQDSLHAGARLLAFLEAVPAAAQCLFLISGGTSSLVEIPVAGVDLATLRRVNQWLLGSALAIAEINTLRKRLSCIKGGRLLRHVDPARSHVFLISDVPGDWLGDIGSGMLVASPARPLPPLPDWLDTLIRTLPDSADASSMTATAVPHRIVATLAQAKAAAADYARGRGEAVHIDETFLAGDAQAAGQALGRRLREGAPGLWVYGGETTVHLPPCPGRGGRNQTLALAAAMAIEGRDDMALLALGTDGSDGPGEDAGALVDGGTVARGVAAGLNAAHCLERADAGSFLAASGDLIRTGPTGTNVMDLVITLRVAP